MKTFSGLSGIGRAVGALLVAGTFLFAMGCSNSNSPVIPPLNGNYTNASLKGQYVMSQTGIGLTQSGGSDFFSETIVFTADGNGSLNVTVDDFNQSGQPFSNTGSGTYRIISDGSGTLFFGNGATYQITMIDDAHFYIIEQDTFATASGFGELQTAISSVPAGTYVFKARSLGNYSRVGAFAVSSGSINATEDLLNLGSLNTSTTLTGSFTGPDSSGRGTFQLSDGSSFHYYLISGGKFYFLSGFGDLEIGQAELQTGGPFSKATLAANSSYVYGSSGDTISNTVAIHTAGVFTSDGNGNVIDGAVDTVQDGIVSSDLSMQVGSGYSLSSNGRGVLSLLLSNGLPNTKIFWMVSPSKAYFLVNNSVAVEDGTIQQQSGGSFTNANMTNQAAFVMDGFDTGFKDRVGPFLPDGGGNLKWNQQANLFTLDNTGTGVGVGSTLATSGTYQVGTNGRVTSSVSNVSGNLVFYLISNGNGYMVQEDPTFDIGGQFSAQSGH
jgi:hypothetical protein